MFCIPFLGSESLLPESRNRFYGGLEVTAFLSAPTSGRLASKRQCNHILSIQQESLGSLSWVAGTWHGGVKAPVTEQAFKAPVAEHAFNGPKPSTKTLDVVKQSERVPKVKFLTGSKPSSHSYSRVKPAIRNFEEQLAVLERIQLQSQVPCGFSEEAQEIHENQLNGVNPAASHVDHSRAGLTRTDLVVEAIFTGHDPVWHEPFVGIHGVQSSKNHIFGRPSGGNKQVLHQLSKSGINSSHHQNEINGFQGIEEKDQVQRHAHQTDGHHTGMPNSIQLLVKEDLCTSNENSVNGYHSSSRGSQAAYSHPDTPSSGSMNGISANGFHLQRQGYGIECSNVGKEGLTIMVEGMQAKESVNVSDASCKVASVRMPAYRISTPLQRSLSDIIFYLESLGADCSRLFRDDPTAMTCTVKQLRALVCALERYGLKSNDFGRIFNLCPKVLHLKDGDLKAVTSFLFDEVGLSRKDFGKVIRRCPRLLVSDIHEQLRATLSFLRNLGYSKMGQVISNNPTLLSFSVERKLIPKLRFLESLGFTYREAASMVVRFPAIFNYSTNDNLQPKYDYLVHKMGGRNKDLLAFPQYFGYSLETRIRPRHECIAKLGVSLSIQAILKLSDGEFNARFSPVGAHDHPPKALSASPETSDSMLAGCSLETAKFVSLEHPEVRVLVGV